MTGCELQHANLRGSNLTGAILKEIHGPLHMSQTVNVTTVSSQVDGAQTPAHGSAPHHHSQGTAPAPAPPQQSHPSVPPHHHHDSNQPGAPPLQLPGDGSREGENVNVAQWNGNDDHHNVTGNAQGQAQLHDNT